MVEPKGVEPSTLCLQSICAPNCATAPCKYVKRERNKGFLSKEPLPSSEARFFILFKVVKSRKTTASDLFYSRRDRRRVLGSLLVTKTGAAPAISSVTGWRVCCSSSSRYVVPCPRLELETSGLRDRYSDQLS